MQIRAPLEALIDDMLDGHILLEEAVGEFESLYIQEALRRHKQHISNTAKVLGIHRNTLSKRVATYQQEERVASQAAKRAAG